jgi:hypothetical protein
MSRTAKISVLLLFLFLFTQSLLAQRNLASLVGTVKDSSGAVVPHATVTAKNLGTDAVRTMNSDASGDYALPDLDVGHYSVTGSMTGFKTTMIKDIELQTGQRARIDIVLELGTVTQEVTVSTTAPLISTTSSDVGQVVDRAVLQDIPLNGRSFWQLTQLTPGANFTPAGSNAYGSLTSIRASAVNVTINGADPDKTGWVLDGSSIIEVQSGGTEVQPNVDAIQEFKVEAGNMDAEFGRTPATVTATIKSGTNQYHGDAFEFVRNDHLDARNFFFVTPPGSSQTKDILKRNQFGGTFGGPIRKDKTFFFVDMEETLVREDEVFSDIVPSVAEREGNFSALSKSLTNPFNSYANFTGNQVSTSSTPATFDPLAAFFLNYLPVPSIAGTPGRAVSADALSLNTSKGDIKIDENINEKNRLMGRYSIVDNTETQPDQFPALGLLSDHARGQDFTLALTHVFNPHWINETRFGYYRMIFLFLPPLEGTNFSLAQTTPLGNDPGYTGFNYQAYGGFPEISISSYTGFDGGPSNQLPKSNHIRTFEYADAVSYSSGKHNIKFGMQLYHNTTGYVTGSQTQGIFTFNGNYTGDAFADFLLGVPATGQRDPGALWWGGYGNWPAWFFQDSFRATQNLTLNLGARYEMNGFYTGQRGQMSGMNLSTGQIIIPSKFDVNARPISAQLLPLYSDRIVYTNSLGLPESIIDMNKHDIAPRIGIAWKPFGKDKWAIRSGYGIFYDYADNNGPNNTVGAPPDTVQDTESQNSKPNAPNRPWENYFLGVPLPGVPNPNPGQPCPAPLTFTAISCSTPSLSTGMFGPHTTSYSEEWNFTVQRELSHNLSMTVAYVGNNAHHQYQGQSVNNPLPGTGNIQPRRPLGEWGTITQYEYGGAANNNALQVSVTSRSWHGMSLLGNYTYWKCLDDGTAGSGAITSSLIPYNRGVCTANRTQASSISYDYVLPFGHGQAFGANIPGWANQVVGGWRMTGILTLQTGLPYTPTISNDQANTGVGSQRPDIISTPVQTDNVACWFYTTANTNCVTLFGTQANWWQSPPADTRYGTGGRDILRADGLRDLDFSLMKTFKVTESKSLEFRAEAFNLTNHPTFSAPSTNVNSGSGGAVTSLLDPARNIQLALKLYF